MKKNRESYVKRKRKDQELVEAHDLIQAWADWVLRYERGANISYAKSSVEGRLARDGSVIRGGGKPSSRVPNGVMMPRHVALIDRAITNSPGVFGWVLRTEYLDEGTARDKALKFQFMFDRSHRAYKEVVDNARAYVLGIRDSLRCDEHRE